MINDNLRKTIEKITRNELSEDLEGKVDVAALTSQGSYVSRYGNRALLIQKTKCSDSNLNWSHYTNQGEPIKKYVSNGYSVKLI